MEVYMTMCFLVSRILYVYSYGIGAPSNACINLTPGHGTSEQTSAIPYTVSLSKTTYEESGQITVTVAGSNAHQGLLIQARKNDGSTTPVGTFGQPSANTKTTSCTKSADSWTHSSTASKQTSTAVWTAPSSNVGQIVFKATVASSKMVYWLNIQSAVVEFSSPTTTQAPTTTRAPTTSQADTTPASTDSQDTTATQKATSPEATNNQGVTTQGATNSVKSTETGGTNTNDDRNDHGKIKASGLFIFVGMVTSILLINKY